MGRREEDAGKPSTWGIDIMPIALQHLKAVKDRRIYTKLIEAINSLAQEPEKKGKPLFDELEDCRSLRAVGQRYRIIYKIEAAIVVVLVLAVGIRKEGDKHDIYRLAQRLARVGLLLPEPPGGDAESEDGGGSSEEDS